MSVELKKSKKETEVVKILNNDIESFVAVKGLKGSFFEGKTKVMHINQAEKQVARKLVEIVKAPLTEVVNKKRVVTDVAE